MRELAEVVPCLKDAYYPKNQPVRNFVYPDVVMSVGTGNFQRASDI